MTIALAHWFADEPDRAIIFAHTFYNSSGRKITPELQGIVAQVFVPFGRDFIDHVKQGTGVVELGLPIIAANLSKKNGQDDARCPAIIRDKGCVLHIPYTLEAIKFTMANWPSGFSKLSSGEINGGWRYYPKFN